MKVLVFGGTTEGKNLAKAIAQKGLDVTLFVATEYGKSVLEQQEQVRVCTKRLDEQEMIAYLESNIFDCVVDATHPYADIVTKNIEMACRVTSTKYMRMVRAKSNEDERVIYVPTVEGAVDLLKDSDGNILVTTGSKNLEHFTKIKDFSTRLHVRIIPMPESLEKAIDLGIRSSNIICMQGPFDLEMNKAIIKKTNSKYIVTKDSGDVGGFSEKVQAALQLGCKVIVVSRPTDESGYTYAQILQFLEFGSDVQIRHCEHSKFFPLFVNLNEVKVLVVGGGKIAERRIKVLKSFEAEIVVISDIVTETVNELIKNGEIEFINRKYRSGDICEIRPFIVIAATNDRAVNDTIMKDAKSEGILVIVSDSRKDCNSYFPAIVESNEYIAGLVSKNGNHAGVKLLADHMRGILNGE